VDPPLQRDALLRYAAETRLQPLHFRRQVRYLLFAIEQLLPQAAQLLLLLLNVLAELLQRRHDAFIEARRQIQTGSNPFERLLPGQDEAFDRRILALIECALDESREI